MRGQPENPLDLGIGQKVDTETAPEPEWKAIPGKPHYYVNAKGHKRYAPPVPDCPMHPSPWDAFAEAMKKAGIEPTWVVVGDEQG
jgi:hypothetical protein